MSAELALGLAGLGLTLLIFILGGLVHVVWLLSGMKSAQGNHTETIREHTKKHARHDSDFKDVRETLANHDGRIRVIESNS